MTALDGTVLDRRALEVLSALGLPHEGGPAYVAAFAQAAREAKGEEEPVARHDLWATAIERLGREPETEREFLDAIADTAAAVDYDVKERIRAYGVSMRVQAALNPPKADPRVELHQRAMELLDQAGIERPDQEAYDEAIRQAKRDLRRRS